MEARMGLPAVPPGSPSSLHLASSPLGVTKAQQLCLAEGSLRSRMPASASAEFLTGKHLATKVDFFTS